VDAEDEHPHAEQEPGGRAVPATAPLGAPTRLLDQRLGILRCVDDEW
jgi:hypothetical protein